MIGAKLMKEAVSCINYGTQLKLFLRSYILFFFRINLIDLDCLSKNRTILQILKLINSNVSNFDLSVHMLI